MGADVCLISPASRANARRVPFGLLYVASYLEKYGGMKAEIIDLKTSPFRSLSDAAIHQLERMILERVNLAKPGLIGITCLVTEVKEVLALSEAIKKLVQDTIIVVGGIHPTMYPEDLLYDGSPVDYVVIGEGEETFTEFVKTISIGHSVQDVPGVAWFDGRNVYRTPPRFPIEDLDIIPFPQYDLIDTNYYCRPGINVIRNMFLSTAQIITSRGCPSQCTFCVNKNLHRIMGSRKLFRQRSVKTVVDEIEFLATRYAVDGFYLCDDAFCIRKQFTFDFCAELTRRNLGLIWGTETRVNLVSREMIETMKDAGCVQLDFGVESGSQKALKRMKKRITIEQVRNVFSWCHELGVRAMANFMFNTTGETEDDVHKTLALAKEIDACYYSFSLMTPFPGTDIYKKVQPKLTVDEYDLFPEAYLTLTDPRFRFAKHDLDLEKLVWKTHVTFNSLWRRASFLLNGAYIKQILKSKKKWDYISTFLEVFGRIVDYYWTHLKFALFSGRR
ncbi:B12-binding domain-containing radical SAM protein [Thermodesulfobacteriota bacterium]